MCISEIAVMAGSDGRSVPLNEPGTVVVYRRNRGAWQEVRTLPFALDEGQGLAGLRRKMAELVAFLGDCRALVAKTASGAVFFELEKARTTVFEISGSPEEFLDTVWREMKEEQDAAAPLPAGADIPAPLKITPGCFSISIRDIQGKRPEVSSKQVLQQFVQQGKFTELEIVCDHVPPWIEMEADRRGYELASERMGSNEVKVLLRRPAGGCC